MAAAGLAWILFAPGRTWGQGQTWAGGNLQKMVEDSRWRLGALRVNAAFSLASAGYDSDIYFGFLPERVPDVLASAATPVQVILPLNKKAVIDVSDRPEYVFYLDTRRERSWNNTLSGRVHVVLERIYVQAGGGMSSVQRRLSPELDLNVRQESVSLSGLVLWQASKTISLAFLYEGAQYSYPEDVYYEALSLADRLNRNEEYLDLIAYVQPSAKVRFSLDAQYGSYQFRSDATGLRDADSYAVFAGAEFIPAERDIPIVRGFQGAATLGYMRLDMRDSFFRDSSGLVGEAVVMARLSKRMSGQVLFSRGYQFSIYSGASYFFSTTMGAGLTRHLSKKADLTYDFTYGRTSYPEFGQGDQAADRYYRYLTHGLRLGLRLARHLGMAFYGSYGQRDRGAYEPIRDRFFAGVSLFFGAAGEGLSVPARGGSQRQAIGSGFAKAAKL